MKVADLLREFPVPSYEEWRAAAEKSLKGASFEAKLLSPTYEGITLMPVYRREDVEGLPHLTGLPGLAPYVRGTQALGHVTRGWEVSQEIADPSPEAFRQTAADALKRGQTMLNVVLDPDALAGQDPQPVAEAAPDAAPPQESAQTGVGTGVGIFTPADMEQALEGISLETVPVFLHTGGLTVPMLSLIIRHLEQKGEDPGKLRGLVGADPLGTLAETGRLPCTLDRAYQDMAEATKWAVRFAPNLRSIHVRSHPYHNGGANVVQDLAFSLATAVEYVRALLERGLTIDQIAAKVQFSFSIGSQVFLEIARLRAARLLWATVVEAFGGSLEAQKMQIHARTSAWNKTVLDPYTNLLRASTEAFSAIVGGADSLHVSPFDEAIGPADEFSRRIARNTQLILKDEAHLDRVADPAGGSWYVEWLTDAVAEKAWMLFQQVEEHGGMAKALQDGFVQQLVAQTAAEKRENIARRKERIVGVNMYPNSAESIPAEKQADGKREAHWKRLQAYRSRFKQDILAEKLTELRKGSDGLLYKALEAVRTGATLGDLARAIGQEQSIAVQPIPFQRAAEAFEALRKQAEEYRQRSGQEPQVYLAAVGPLSRYKARADFCTEFFAVGGFAVLGLEQPAASAEEAAARALSSGARIVVICAEDERYPEIVEPLARALKEKRSDVIVLLAGFPAPDQAEAYRAAGVEEYVHLRGNCWQLLYDLQKRTGVIA